MKLQIGHQEIRQTEHGDWAHEHIEPSSRKWAHIPEGGPLDDDVRLATTERSLADLTTLYNSLRGALIDYLPALHRHSPEAAKYIAKTANIDWQPPTHWRLTVEIPTHGAANMDQIAPVLEFKNAVGRAVTSAGPVFDRIEWEELTKEDTA